MNSKKKLERQLIVSLLTTTVIVGMATGLVLYHIFPVYWFCWYPLIPAYFVLLGVVISLGVGYCHKQEPKKFISYFILMRVIKMMLTMGFIFLYYLIINEKMTEVAFLTCGFYALFLFIETWLLYHHE